MQDLSLWITELGQQLASGVMRAQTGAASGATETAAAGSGGPDMLIIALVVVAVVVFAFLVWRMLRPSPTTEDAPISVPKKEQPEGLHKAEPSRPTVDPLSQRKEVEKPSEISSTDSLRDIKIKKMERIQVSSYEEARKELQARKAGQVKKEQQARRRREREEANAEEQPATEPEEQASTAEDTASEESDTASEDQASSEETVAAEDKPAEADVAEDASVAEEASATEEASAVVEAEEQVSDSAEADVADEDAGAADVAKDEEAATAQESEVSNDTSEAVAAVEEEAPSEPDESAAVASEPEAVAGVVEAASDEADAAESEADVAESEEESKTQGALGGLDEGWGDIDFDSFSLGDLGTAKDDSDGESVEADAEAEVVAKAAAEEDAKAAAKAEAEAAEKAEAVAKAEVEAKAKAKTEAKAAAKAKAEAEAKAAKKAKALEDKAKTEAEAKAKAKAKIEAEAAAKVKAEEKAAAKAKAKAEAAEIAKAKALEDVEREAEAKPAQESKEDRVGGKSLKDGLKKTRSGFISRLGDLFKQRNELDEDLLEEVEEVLFTADIGPRTVEVLLEMVQTRLSAEDAGSPDAVWSFIRDYTEKILRENERPLVIPEKRPFVILVVGVNGVGKTTTIGKLATRYADDGLKVLMVAGDTFRAAATEQLEEWGERTEIPVHIGNDGVDPASVVYGGIERGIEEDFDVIICDTAGRLTNKKNLMKELEKIGRVAGKALDGAPHETLLVLDANTGLMAIEQANMFRQVVDISGLVLTKLDGTAKGGVIIGICQALQVPVRFIGIGEGVYDLREFKAHEFVEALFM